MVFFAMSASATEMSVDDIAGLEACLTQLGGEYQKVVKTARDEAVVTARRDYPADTRTTIARNLWRIGQALEPARGEVVALREQHCGKDQFCGSDRKTGVTSADEKAFVDASKEIGKRKISIDLLEFSKDEFAKADISAVLERQCAAVMPWVRE
jgi:hypothetical protein